MALAKEDIEEIRGLIVSIIAERQPERSEMAGNNVRFELEIRERIVRVEEELKHQRELMLEGFNRVDKRFEQLIGEMNARFEQIDKRFEVMTGRIDRFMIWSFATTLTVGGIVIAAIKYLP